MFAKTLTSLRKFHSDEEGLEALQVVMIISIAAMVMIAVAAIGKAANKFMGGHANTLLNNTDLTTPEGFGGGTRGTSVWSSFDGLGTNGGAGGGGGTRPEFLVLPQPPLIIPLNK